MATFLFTCPASGMKVQGWRAEEPEISNNYEAVECTACGGTHLVNPSTGDVLGSIPSDKAK